MQPKTDRPLSVNLPQILRAKSESETLDGERRALAIWAKRRPRTRSAEANGA